MGENPYPVFKGGTAAESAKRQRPRGYQFGLGSALLCVVVGFVLLFFVAAKLADCRGWGKADGSKPNIVCDKAGVQARQDWFETPTKLREERPKLSALGFTIDGACSEKIESRQLSCDDQTVVGVESDSPYLREALATGFLTYVCLQPATHERVEYDLAALVHGRAVRR